MKIALVNDTYYPDNNGCAYFTHRLALNLAKKGHQILVVAPSRRRVNELYEREKVTVFGVRSVPILLTKEFRFSPPIMMKKSIEERLLDFKPDVVHVQGHILISRIATMIARKHNIPLIGTNHFMPDNLAHFVFSFESGQKIAKKLAWQDFKRVFDKVDIVTTPTQTAANLLKDINFKKEVYPISCGIDLKRFKPGNNGEYLRKRYNLPNKKILVYVGRLDKEKHIDWALEALALVPKEVDVHYVVGGKGNEKLRLEKMAEALGVEKRVTFVGFVPDKDLANFYQLANGYIIAGIAELQSITTMEAMASGLPVIAVNAVALPELAQEGKNALLFEPEDYEKMAENIIRVFSDEKLRQKMAQESLKIIQKHNINNTVKQYEDFYKLIIEKRKPK